VSASASTLRDLSLTFSVYFAIGFLPWQLSYTGN
jgi:hypothetical protein